ncbi:MAG: LTA synthase family protein, partial [Bacteroidia bacterium]
MLHNLLSKVPAHIRLLLKLYILNLFLFFCVRLLFYFVNRSSDVAAVSFVEKLMAFRMGLEFDTAVFCWIACLPALLWSLAYFSKRLSFLYAFGFYSFLVLLFVYYLACCADIPYFKQFGNHLNKNALLWNESPGFIAGLIFGSFSYWGYLILCIIVNAVLFRYSNRFFSHFKKEEGLLPQPKWFVPLVSLAVLAGLVTIGARGRTSDRSGLHEGLSIVSQNNFVNQVAINPNFTFWKTVIYNDEKRKYIAPPDIAAKIAFTRHYLGIPSGDEQSISRAVTNDSIVHKYNFVIVVMESMSVFKMGYYNGKNLCPNLTNIIRRSVFCENFFSSGIHTFNGLFSTTSGYPSIYAEKSMKSYVKNPFDGLGTMLSSIGYDTWFYTTHDPHFDNMLGFFRLNKFSHSVSQYDFSFTQAESSLGVPDHLLFDKLIENTNKRKDHSPFLSVLMTASDHGPWKIPKDIPFTPSG